MKKHLKPLANRVIIKKSAPDEMTKGGIWIPDTSKDESPLTSGVVMRVGRGMLKDFIKGESVMVPAFDTPEVKPGDVVLFDRHAGAVITDDNGDKLQIVRETDIYAVERSK